MSEPHSDQPADVAQPNQPASSPPAKPPRSPVERLIVWGGIAIGLLLVAVQAHARFGYDRTLTSLKKKVAADDIGENPEPLLLGDVSDHIVGWPKRTDDKQSQMTTLSWTGLGRSYEIYIAYDDGEGDQAAVLGIQTKNAPPPEEPEPPPESADDDISPVASAGPGGGGYVPQHDPTLGAGDPSPGSGGGQGGGRFDPWQFDADGDRRITLEEASDRMKENFEQLDTNADGELDEDEVAAMLARRGQRNEGERPERPGRPELESEGESDATDAAPDASAAPDPDGDAPLSSGDSDSPPTP